MDNGQGEEQPGYDAGAEGDDAEVVLDCHV